MNAHDEVLRICRSERHQGKYYREVWCMRELSAHSPRFKDGPCVVVDNARWDSKVVAQGNSWEEVLAKLQEMNP